MSRIYLTLCVLIGFGLPAVVFFSGELPIPAVLLIILGMLWLATPLGRLGWYWGFALFLGTAINAYGAYINVPPLFPIISTIFILSAWNLGRFQLFLSLAGEGDNTNKAERHQLKYLVIFQLVSVVVSLGTVTIRIEINFLQAILLVMLVFFGLLQLVRWLVRSDQKNI